MGRAFSWSLAAHLVFIVSFLLLSATRQPLTVPQIVRPVRLVTYLEPAAAPRQRAAVPAAAEVPRPATARAEPRVPLPPAAAPRPAAVPVLPAPRATPRVVIPTQAQPPAASRTKAPQVEAPPALSERLARRLASAAPVESRPAELASLPPPIASLPPPQAVASLPSPDRAVTGAPPSPREAVTPVGYFPHAWYLAVLKDNVFARWTPPSEFFQSRRPPVAVVSFRIDRAGRVSGVTLKEGSGSARFDKSALAVIQGLGTVAALPEQYREETLDVVIRFQQQ